MAYFLFEKAGFAQETLDGGLDGGKLRLLDGVARNKDNVIPGLHVGYHGTEGFPQPALDAVSFDAVAYLFAHGKAHVHRIMPRPRVDEHEPARGERLSLAVYIAELFVPL